MDVARCCTVGKKCVFTWTQRFEPVLIDPSACCCGMIRWRWCEGENICGTEKWWFNGRRSFSAASAWIKVHLLHHFYRLVMPFYHLVERSTATTTAILLLISWWRSWRDREIRVIFTPPVSNPPCISGNEERWKNVSNRKNRKWHTPS